jgi:hypothetical protein
VKTKLDALNATDPNAAGPLLKDYAAALLLQKDGAHDDAIKALAAIESELARLARKLDESDDLSKANVSGWNADAEREFLAKWLGARNAWRTASDAVDDQITGLQQAMKKDKFREIREIAEFGLNGATGNFKTPLLAAMMGIESAKGLDRLKEVLKARKVVQGFKSHLSSSELVEVIDGNPFEVTVTIRPTLIPALDALDDALKFATTAIGK